MRLVRVRGRGLRDGEGHRRRSAHRAREAGRRRLSRPRHRLPRLRDQASRTRRTTNRTSCCEATWRSSTRQRTARALRSRRSHQHGVAIKVLTGDNEAVSRKVCRDVGMAVTRVLIGRANRVDGRGRLGHGRGGDAPLRAVVAAPQAARGRGPAAARQRRRLPRRRHQRCARVCVRPTWASPSIRRPTSRKRVGGPHPAREEPHGAGRRHRRRAQGLREHPASTSAWARARTSATCSACSGRARCSRSCRWRRSRS